MNTKTKKLIPQQTMYMCIYQESWKEREQTHFLLTEGLGAGSHG